MAEAQQTTNPVRLYVLALQIDEALQKAYKRKPNDPELLLDLVRFHTVTPAIAGGAVKRAKSFAKKLATLDPGLGHLATGYMAYREKQFGVARRELKEAVRVLSGAHRNLALQWLGWLSQESQQYDDAFATWEELRASDPKASYEIARTAMFCRCQKERGRAALEAYLKVRPKDEEAKKLAEKLR
ncbi:MAG TPA: hypothetical protein VHW00_07150 [Thermoanaerobaculia bacterium]|nr:hypothetical protein [Thermoanaerobaculia bacterium]